jgi:hypothetical protein
MAISEFSATSPEGLRAHDVEAEPADRQHPGAEREERDARRRMRADRAVLAVAVAARPEQQHRGERHPAADRVDDDAAGEIVELGAGDPAEPSLHAEVPVPDDTLEERIDEADEDRGRHELRHEARALGDAAGDDRRDRRRERQQEEELDERVAVLRREHVGADEEVHAVGDAVADEEVGDGRDREVDHDLDQRVDLVLRAHGAELEEGEAAVHGQHHDRAEQDEECIAAAPGLAHRLLPAAGIVVTPSLRRSAAVAPGHRSRRR